MKNKRPLFKNRLLGLHLSVHHTHRIRGWHVRDPFQTLCRLLTRVPTPDHQGSNHSSMASNFDLGTFYALATSESVISRSREDDASPSQGAVNVKWAHGRRRSPQRHLAPRAPSLLTEVPGYRGTRHAGLISTTWICGSADLKSAFL